MSSIYYFSKPGASYSQPAVSDSRQAAINEQQRKAVCENRLFKDCLKKAGLEQLRPDEIAISVILGQSDKAPLLQFWKVGTGQRFTIDAETYQKDPFLLGYVRYQIGLDAEPPQEGEFSEEEVDPGAPVPANQKKPPDLQEKVEQAQSTAKSRSDDSLRDLLKEQRKHTARMEKRFEKLIRRLEKQHQETLQTLLDLREPDQENRGMRQPPSDRRFRGSDDRYAALLRETQHTFRNLNNRNNDRFADLFDAAEERHEHLQGQFERFRRDTADEYHELVRELHQESMQLMAARDAEFQHFFFSREAAFADFANSAQQRFEGLMNHQLRTQAEFANALDQRYGELLTQVLADRARGDGEHQRLVDNMLETIRRQGQANRDAEANLLTHQARINDQYRGIIERLLGMIGQQGPAVRAPHFDAPGRGAAPPPSDLDTDSDSDGDLQPPLSPPPPLPQRNREEVPADRSGAPDASVQAIAQFQQELQQTARQIDEFAVQQAQLQRALDQAAQQRDQAAAEAQQRIAAAELRATEAQQHQTQLQETLEAAQGQLAAAGQQREQAAAEAQQQIAAAERRVTEAQQQQTQLQGALDQAAQQQRVVTDEARQQIATAERRVTEAQQQQTQLQGKLEAAQGQLAAANQQREQAAAEVEQLRAQLGSTTPRDNANRRAAEAQQQFEQQQTQLQGELEAAQGQLAAANQQREQAAAEAQQQIATATQQSERLQAQLSETEKQIGTLTQHQAQLQGALDQAAQQQRMAAAEVEQLRAQLGSTTPRDNANRRAAEAQQQFEQQQTQLQETLEAAQRQLTDATQQSERLQVKLAEIRQQLTSANEQRDEAAAAVEALQTQLGSMTPRDSANRRATEAQQQFERQQTQLQGKLEEATRLQQAAAAQVEQLRAQLADMTPRNRARQRTAEAQQQFEQQQTQLQGKLEAAQGQLAAANQQREQAAAEAQQQIATATQQSERLQAQLSETEKQIGTLTQHQAQLQGALDQAEQQVTSANQQREQAAAEVEKLRAQLGSTTPRDSANRRAAEAQQQFEQQQTQLQGELETAQRQLAAANQQREQAATEAQQQIATATQQSERLQAQLSETEKQIGTLTQRQAQLQGALDQAGQQLTSANEQRDEAAAAVEALQTQLGSMTPRAKAQERIQEMAEEQVGLTVALAEMATALQTLRAVPRPPLQLTTHISAKDLRAQLHQMAVPLPQPRAARLIDRVPQAIRQGALDGLVAPPQALDLVKQALQELLRNGGETSDILHLAIYAATHDQAEIRKNDALFESLLNWASRTSLNGLDDQQKTKFNTLSLALSEKPGTICGPLSLCINEGLILSQIREEAGIEPIEKRNWARALLQKEEPTELENDLQERFRADLRARQNIPRLYHYKEKRDLNLAEQLCSDIDPANPKNHLAVYSKEGKTEQEQWLASWTERERYITESIDRILGPDTFKQRVREAYFNEKDRVLAPAKEKPDDSRLVAFTEMTRRNQSLSEEQRAEYKEAMRDEILGRLMTQSGLPCAHKSCVEHLAQTAVQMGDLPPFVKKVLAKQSPEEVRTVGNFLYNYIALSTPPRKGHEHIACHEDWKWLQQDASPEEGTRRLMKLLQQKQQMSKLRPPDDPQAFAYPVTRKQVDWVHNFARAFAGKSANPLYEDAGAGKTSIAELAIRAFKAEDQPVYLLSPFKTNMPGVQAIQFKKGPKEYTIDVPAAENLDNAVVIVDEAHVLEPDAEIVLRHGDQTRIASPLLMTATPIVPQGTYAEFKRTKMAPKYRQEADAVSEQLARAEIAIQSEKKAARQKYIETQRRKILRNIDICTPYMPNARSRFYNEIERDVKTSLVTPHSQNIEPLQNLKNQLDSWLKECKNDLEPYLTLRGQKNSFDKGRPLFCNMSKDLSDLIDALSQTPEQMGFSGEVNPRSIEERDRLRALRNSIHEKVMKWSQAEDINAERYEKVRAQQQKLLSQMAYQSSDVRDAAQFAAASPAMRERVSQLIFPGLAFNQQEFPRFIEALRGQELVQFVYHNSHHEQHAGEDRVIQSNGTETAFDPSQLTQGKVAMLYDTTNSQGGDFGVLSMAQPGSDIGQAIFTSGSDVTLSGLVQWSGRRRGTSALPSHIYGIQETREQFLETARKNQAELEHKAALQVAAKKIARKALKITARMHPQPSYEEALKGLTIHRGSEAFADAKAALMQIGVQPLAAVAHGLLKEALDAKVKDWKVWTLQDQMEHFAEWYRS